MILNVQENQLKIAQEIVFKESSKSLVNFCLFSFKLKNPMKKSLLGINFEVKREILIYLILMNLFNFIFEKILLIRFHFEAQIIVSLNLFPDFEVDDQKNFMKIKDY